ncbi:MAG: ribbon-helix-helix protein, CopG family [Chloroflexi bacterium]|nr:ribbon-helix-helix protein, CopG family [Chloroflexota bacterium]
MKTAISIPDPIFQEAEQLAKKLGMSRSELFTRAVAAFLEEKRQENITARLNKLYEKEPSQLDPVIARIQFASLPEDEW